MEALAAFALKYILPFAVGLLGAVSPVLYKLLAFRLASRKASMEEKKEERTAESQYRDKEWEALTRLRDHFDRRLELLAKENEDLRLRVKELEQQVDELRENLLQCETARLELERENVRLKGSK